MDFSQWGIYKPLPHNLNLNFLILGPTKGFKRNKAVKENFKKFGYKVIYYMYIVYYNNVIV